MAFGFVFADPLRDQLQHLDLQQNGYTIADLHPVTAFEGASLCGFDPDATFDRFLPKASAVASLLEGRERLYLDRELGESAK